MKNNKITLLNYFKISIIYICYAFLSIFVCVIIAEAFNSNILDFFSIDISQLISVILIMRYIHKKFNVTLMSLLNQKNFNKLTLLFIFILTISSYVVINSATTILSNNIIIIPHSSSKSYDSIDSLNNICLCIFFISISIISPIIEEILFRGILLLKLKDDCNQIVALIISSLIFSTLHSSGYGQIVAFFFGLLLGTIVLKTNGILYSILCHITWNSLTTLIVFLNIYNPNILPINNGYIHFNLLTQISSLIIFAIMCFICFKSKTYIK